MSIYERVVGAHTFLTRKSSISHHAKRRKEEKTRVVLAELNSAQPSSEVQAKTELNCVNLVETELSGKSTELTLLNYL
jgi:hypothetical protein